MDIHLQKHLDHVRRGARPNYALIDASPSIVKHEIVPGKWVHITKELLADELLMVSIRERYAAKQEE